MSKVEVNSKSAELAAPTGQASNKSLMSSLIETGEHVDYSSIINHKPAGVTDLKHPVQAIQDININITIDVRTTYVEPSPCEIIPPYASPNLIPTLSNNFETVRSSITEVLSSRPEIAFYYDADFQSFHCKVSEGTFSRTYQLDCYFDPKSKDHKLDLRKVSGSDGFKKFSFDLNTLITQKFDPSYQAPLISAGVLTRGVPAALLEEIEAEAVASSGPSPLQLYLDGVDQIVALSKHNFFETRVQGMRIICDMAAAEDKAMLCHQQCVSKLVDSVSMGLNDQYPEVQEYAVAAAESLSSIPAYTIALGQVGVVVGLVGQLRSYPDKEIFLHVHTIRSAARTLSTIASVATDIALEALQSLKITDAGSWEQYIQAVADDAAKSVAAELSAVFEADALPLDPYAGDAPCEVVPSYLHLNNFHVKEDNVAVVDDKLKKCFARIPEVATSYFPVDHSFRSKMVCQSDVVVFTTNVFYDRSTADFVVEVRRISGEGILDQARDLFSRLQTLYHNVDAPVAASSSSDVAGAEELLGSCPVTFEQFMVSIGHIISFARDRFAESRIEGVKMLIDSRYSSVSAGYLVKKECVETIVDALAYLVRDSMAEVQELALIAIQTYTAWSVDYAGVMASRTEAVEAMLLVLRDLSLGNELFCNNAIRVRAAASALSVIFSQDSDMGRKVVGNVLAVNSKSEWDNFASGLISSDATLEASLQRIGAILF